MEEEYSKKTLIAVILLALIILSFFILKPILMAIISGVILAFIFNPIYNKVNKIIKSKNISTTIICILLFLLIFIPFWFLTPIAIEQSFKVYLKTQQMDFITPLKNIFPSFSEEFSAEIGSIIHSFVTKITNSLMNGFSQLILNFPTLFLQFLVASFTFFFVLRDKEQLISYLKSLSPFSKDVEKKFFDYSQGITYSVIYGQVVIGIFQGIIAGIGFLIFQVPNALLLLLIAVLAGIFPIIGTTLVWIPVAIYLFIAGNNIAAFGVIIFGLVASSIDNFLRPWIVSRRVHMHSALILIGMVGGLFLFGVLGFILGPLILAYLLIILEIYRKKKSFGLFINEEKEKK